MKTILFVLIASVSNFAAAYSSEYIVETGAVLVKGQAAMDLYEDMEAREKVIFAVSRQEEREKKQGSVRCVGEFLRGLSEDGQLSDASMVDATCTVKIPANIIGPRY